MEVTVRVFDDEIELGGFKAEIKLRDPRDSNGQARAEVGEAITKLLQRLERERNATTDK